MKLVTSDDGEKPQLTLTLIEDLHRKGNSYAEIARMLGVSRQAVSWHRMTYGGPKARKTVLDEVFPCKVKPEHAKASAFYRLREHGRYMVFGIDELSGEQVARLRGFYRRQEHEVLIYHPNVKPNSASAQGGWKWVPREPRDGDYLIRPSSRVTYNDADKEIWRIPPLRP